MKASKPQAAQQPLSAKFYAWIALVTAGLGIFLLFFYIHVVPRLVQNGTEKQFFYILLFPWGLCCAMALFGAMRSYARFSSNQLGGLLELGGPVVLFCLVVVGGFKLVPSVDSFDLTVRAHSKDEPIIRGGQVTIDFETQRRTEPIYSNGEANFKGVAQKFQGTTVNVVPDVQGYRKTPQKISLQKNVIDLDLEKSPMQSLLRGTILPPPGPGSHLRVVVDGQESEATPDDLGRFQMLVEGRDGDGVRLRVYSAGKIVYDDFQFLPGPVTLLLNRESRAQ